jgi:iron complex transport system substrate-binding protein
VSIAALVLLAGTVLWVGCGQTSPRKAQAAEASAAGATPSSQAAARSGPPATTRAGLPAATRASRPTDKFAVRDYVIEPQVCPAEKDAGPRRIVSMAPNLTELCWALGLGDRMVGRTQYCLYPPAARKVEVIGALLDPNIERLLALQPDMVLITTSSGMLKDRFAYLKLPVVSLPDSSLDDIFRSIRLLGDAAKRPVTAATLAGNLRTDLDRLRDEAPGAVKPYRVLVVTGALPNPPRSIWVAGPGSYLDSLLRLAGAKNAVEGDRAWLEIGVEQVLWLRPDAIVEVREPAQAPQRDEAVAAWQKLPGLAKVRVVTLTDPAVLVPGPRVNVMLEKLTMGLSAKEGG